MRSDFDRTVDRAYADLRREIRRRPPPSGRGSSRLLPPGRVLAPLATAFVAVLVVVGVASGLWGGPNRGAEAAGDAPAPVMAADPPTSAAPTTTATTAVVPVAPDTPQLLVYGADAISRLGPGPEPVLLVEGVDGSCGRHLASDLAGGIVYQECADGESRLVHLPLGGEAATIATGDGALADVGVVDGRPRALITLEDGDVQVVRMRALATGEETSGPQVGSDRDRAASVRHGDGFLAVGQELELGRCLGLLALDGAWILEGPGLPDCDTGEDETLMLRTQPALSPDGNILVYVERPGRFRQPGMVELDEGEAVLVATDRSLGTELGRFTLGSDLDIRYVDVDVDGRFGVVSRERTGATEPELLPALIVDLSRPQERPAELLVPGVAGFVTTLPGLRYEAAQPVPEPEPEVESPPPTGPQRWEDFWFQPVTIDQGSTQVTVDRWFWAVLDAQERVTVTVNGRVVLEGAMWGPNGVAEESASGDWIFRDPDSGDLITTVTQAEINQTIAETFAAAEGELTAARLRAQEGNSVDDSYYQPFAVAHEGFVIEFDRWFWATLDGDAAVTITRDGATVLSGPLDGPEAVMQDDGGDLVFSSPGGEPVVVLPGDVLAAAIDAAVGSQ